MSHCHRCGPAGFRPHLVSVSGQREAMTSVSRSLGARIRRSGPGSGGAARPDCIPPNRTLVGLYLWHLLQMGNGLIDRNAADHQPLRRTPRSTLRRDNQILGFDQRSSLRGGARGKKYGQTLRRKPKRTSEDCGASLEFLPPPSLPSQIGSLGRQGPSAESCSTSAESLGG